MTRPAPSARLQSVTGIGLREASRKYGVPLTTLHGWVRAGLIRVLERPARRGQPMLVYERDIAEMAPRYTPGRSRWNRPDLPPVHAA